MASCKWFVLVVMAVLAFSSEAQKHDENFCQLVTKDDSQGKFPALPQSYSAIAELKNDNSPDLTYARIKAQNRGGRVDFRSKYEHTVAFYSSDTKELIIVNLQKDTFDPEACTVVTKDTPEEKDEYDLIKRFIHLMDDLVKRSIGQETVRGLTGDLLESCDYYPKLNRSTKVEWVIANNRSAVGETDLISMPLQMRITNKQYSPIESVNTEIIDFFEFRSPLKTDDDIYLIPDRFYCANKKRTKDLPKLSKFFSFESEISLSGAQPNYLYEEYDFDMGLTRMDFYARFPYDKYSKYGSGLLTRVHDFNMGLEFILNNQNKDCFYQAINESSVDTRRVNNTFYWRMRDPGEFFHLESNRSYQYSGQMKTRGQLAHVFMSQRKVSVELEAGLKVSVNGTYTWFFVDNKDHDAEATVVDLIPIRMEYYSELENYDLNIFNFKTQEPTLMDFSVSQCFKDLPHEKYAMEFDVSQAIASRIDERRDQFQHWFEVSVAASGKVSFLRIRMDEVKLTGVRLFARFTLYDKPKLVASPQEASLQDAVKNLFSEVDGGTFSFFLPNAQNDLEVVEAPKGSLKKFQNDGSSTPVPPQPTGSTARPPIPSGSTAKPPVPSGATGQPPVPSGSTLKPGDDKAKKEDKSPSISSGLLVFLLILMLVVGGVLGCGVLYLIYRKNGRLPGGPVDSGYAVSMNNLK